MGFIFPDDLPEFILSVYATAGRWGVVCLFVYSNFLMIPEIDY